MIAPVEELQVQTEQTLKFDHLFAFKLFFYFCFL